MFVYVNLCLSFRFSSSQEMAAPYPPDIVYPKFSTFQTKTKEFEWKLFRNFFSGSNFGVSVPGIYLLITKTQGSLNVDGEIDDCG